MSLAARDGQARSRILASLGQDREARQLHQISQCSAQKRSVFPELASCPEFLPALRRISSATVANAQAPRAAASRADRAGNFIAKVSRWLLHGARGAEF